MHAVRSWLQLQALVLQKGNASPAAGVVTSCCLCTGTEKCSVLLAALLFVSRVCVHPNLDSLQTHACSCLLRNYRITELPGYHRSTRDLAEFESLVGGFLPPFWAMLVHTTVSWLQYCLM
jgi:hypothetical protein